MKVVRKFCTALVLCMSLMLVMPSVISDKPLGMTVEAAKKVKLNKKTAYVCKGDTVKLSLSGTSKKAKWSTSSRKIATVSSKGVVKGIKKGKANIIAKVGNKKYVCRVTVETPSISKKTASINAGSKLTLKVKNTKQKVSWKSSNRQIATVTSKGVVKGVKKGSATITAKIGKKKLTCRVTVKKAATSQSVIKYIGDRDVDYDEESQSHRVFFSLILSDGVTRVSSSGTLRVVIYNDADEQVYRKDIVFSKADFDYWTYEYSGEKCLLCCIEIPNSQVGLGSVSTGRLGYQVVLPTGMSTQVYVAEVDSLPTVSAKDNLNALKNYIQKNGKLNSSGERFISYTSTEDGVSYGIVYDSANNGFKFVHTLDIDGIQNSLRMYLNINHDGTASVENITIVESAGVGLEAVADINIATYNLDQTVRFNVVMSTEGLTDASIQKSANASLKSAFAGWEYLLLRDTGLHLKDIGFLSYN